MGAKRNVLWIVVLIIMTSSLKAQMKQDLFEFDYEGVTLHGVLNLPEDKPPKGIALIIHGSGQTNAVKQELHHDVREQLVRSGYGTYMWDKMGCGLSGGTFDYNQTVESSAMEAIAAIDALRMMQVPAAESIGLWGLSRAGWTIPIVITHCRDIKFWISVSGTDEKENFKYLLRNNLTINGHPKDSVELLVNQWQEGVRICHSGRSYEAYQAATQDLNRNTFIRRFMNGSVSESGYYTYQASVMKEEIDVVTGLQVYVPDFAAILSNVNCPVLALFGEKDMHVDWTKTKALYEKTIGRINHLTIQSFPDCNHNMFKCRTGGFYEFEDNDMPWDRCEGFLETIGDWLAKLD